MTYRFPHTPLLPVLPCIVAGVLLVHFGGGGFWLPLGFMFAGVVFMLLSRKGLALLSMSVMIGWMAAYVAMPRSFAEPPQSSTRYQGVVAEADAGRSTLRLTVDVSAQTTNGTPRPIDAFRAVVYVPDFQDVPSLGAEISFSGIYSLPKRQTDLPGEDDNVSRSFIRGVSLYCTAPPDSIERLGLDRSIASRMRRYRQEIVDRLVCSDLTEPTSAILAAIITGDDSMVSDAERDKYAVAGVAHVLALSGAHVAVIVAIVVLLLFPLSLAGWHKMRWVSAIAALWLFAMFTGMSASVVRASIMATAVMGAILLDRPRSSLNALCFAAILILIFSPRSLYAIGFQMSFMATLGIILFAMHFTSTEHRHRWWQKCAIFVGITLSATAATLPLSMLYFHRIPIFFIPANVLIVLFLPVMIVGGLLFVGLMLIGVNIPLLTDALNFVCGLQQTAVGWLSALPGASVEDVYVSVWVVIGLYVAVFIAFGALIWRRRVLGLLSVGVLMVVVASALLFSPKPEKEQLIVIRSKTETSLLWRYERHAELYKTINRWLTPTDSLTIEKRCHDYLAAHGARLAKVVKVEPAGEALRRVEACGKSIDIAFAMPADTVAQKVDYCLVVHQFRGDVVELAARARCDTLLLSPDIAKRRYERFERELRQADVPFISLRDESFSLPR